MSIIGSPFPKPTPPLPIPLPDPEHLPKIVEVVKKIGRRIGNAISALFAPDEELNKKKVLNEKTNTAADLVELHNLLGSYRADAKTAGKDILVDVKSECNAFFDKTIDQFERYSKDFGMQYMAGSYKKKFLRMIDDLDDVFDDCISRNISMDNSECLSILKMMPGESKVAKMTEFRKSVFVKALDNVCKQINIVMDDFFETVDNTFTNKLNSMSDSIEKSTAAFEKLSDEGTQSSLEKENIQLEAYYNIAIVDIALSTIGGDH